MNARRVVAQTRMELTLLLRNGENLLVTLVIPVGLLVFFSTVEVLPLEADAVGFLFPGMLAVAVMSSGMVSLAIATGFERSYLVLKRLGATPLRRGELVAAKVLAVGAVEVAQIATLTGMALLLGWRARVTPGGAAVAVVALAAGTGAFVGIGMGVAGRVRAVTTLAVVNGLFVGLLLVGDVVVPLERLPSWLGRVAAVTPLATLAAALRAVLGGQATPWGPLAVLGVWAVAAPAVAARLFRWDA